MASSKQADLLDPSAQGELFAAPAEPAYRPNLDKVRARLEKLLAEARAAQTMPWEPSQLSLYRLIFPQMTNWLPDEEAFQYRMNFDQELERLEGPDA
jgi:hypothetical protein